MTPAQKEALVEFMENHLDLRKGKFSIIYHGNSETNVGGMPNHFKQHPRTCVIGFYYPQ